MGYRDSFVPLTIAASIVAFSVLVIQTPLLISLRLLGMINTATFPDWIFVFFILGLILSGYGLKTKLFWDSDDVSFSAE